MLWLIVFISMVMFRTMCIFCSVGCLLVVISSRGFNHFALV